LVDQLFHACVSAIWFFDALNFAVVLARNIVQLSLIFVKSRQAFLSFDCTLHITHRTPHTAHRTLHIVAITQPIQAGFPLESQRGAIALAIDASTLLRVACPKPELKKGNKARQGRVMQHVR
jgi:hypothetical protein